ncbi:hypothetical protein D4S03_00640 [bacterium]|nr:MAG: hypothetical protein D4S03_00640 [bacterium]
MIRPVQLEDRISAARSEDFSRCPDSAAKRFTENVKIRDRSDISCCKIVNLSAFSPNFPGELTQVFLSAKRGGGGLKNVQRAAGS